MSKSHVAGIDPCICVPSKELIMGYVWRLVKCSSKCHILSLAHQIRITTRVTCKFYISTGE